MSDDANDTAAEIRRLRGEIAASCGIMAMIVAMLVGRNLALQRTIIAKIDSIVLDHEDHLRVEGLERFKHRFLESLNSHFSKFATHDESSSESG